MAERFVSLPEDDFELRFGGIEITGAMRRISRFVVFTKEIALEGVDRRAATQRRKKHKT